MTRRYTYTTCLSFGTDGEADYSELDATVSFTATFGRASTYDDPAEDPEIDDIRVEQIDGRPAVTFDRVTVDAIEHEFATGAHDADLLASAQADAADDHAQAIERRSEDRAERNREIEA